MNEITSTLKVAYSLLLSGDRDLYEIVGRSLMVSLTAVGIASLLGVPLGAILAITRFPARKLAITLINSLMGLPPVVVGLVVYLMLSRAGPLGSFGWLFTPTAMIVAQVILITPLVCALTHQTLEDLWLEYSEQLRSFALTLGSTVRTLVWEARFNLLTALLAGFGRAISEVGAVLIVGGNIAHVTRVMTTAIALETARGELALALALGVVLILVAVVINGIVALTRGYALRRGS